MAREMTMAKTGERGTQKLRRMILAWLMASSLLVGVADVSVARAQTGVRCATPNFAGPRNSGADLGANAVTSGDFNRDNNLDLAVANRTADDISVLLGDGAGNFAAAVDFGVGNAPGDIITRDFNNDGKLDLATSNLISDDVSVLLGDGAGNFAAGPRPPNKVSRGLNSHHETAQKTRSCRGGRVNAIACDS